MNNDMTSLRAARSVSGLFFVAIIDTIMLGIVIVWLLFVCGAGTLPTGAITTLTLLHLAHILIIVSSCIVFPFVPFSSLYIPIWFIVVALAIAGIDVFVVVSRSIGLFDAPMFTFGCDFFMWLFDVFFLILDIFYLGFITSSISWFGLFGNSLDDNNNNNNETVNLLKKSPQESTSTTAATTNISIGSATTTSNQSATMPPKLSLHKKYDDVSEEESLLKPTSGRMFGLPNATASSRRRALKDHFSK